LSDGNHARTSSASLLTIEEYLQCVDCGPFKLDMAIEEASQGDFFWMRSSSVNICPLNLIDLPKQFAVVVTYLDPSEFEMEIYNTIPGWRVVAGSFAICEFTNSIPKLYDNVSNAAMIIDRQVSDETLLKLLPDLYQQESYGEPNSLEELEDEESARFWNVIAAINPHCYYSYGLCAEGFTLIVRTRDLFRQYLDRYPVEEIENQKNKSHKDYRANLWKDLGPESGPAPCVELECERLRIKLAARCFIHQLIWGGQLPANR